MKSFLFIAGIVIFSSFSKTSGFCTSGFANYADTGHIVHVLDGLAGEWPGNKFQINADSTVEYATDNDDKNLYVIMSIPDFEMQMKIMRNGMNLYIDLKGKKKEGRGIEFPIKGQSNISGMNTGSASNTNGNNAGSDQPKKKFDKKAARNIMSLGLNAIKLFGLGDNGKEEQGLTMPGSVNIAFKWDDSDVMHIEYIIPLSLLGELSSLNQKDISMGWKINGFERPAGMERSGGNEENPASNFSRGMGSGGGGRGRSQYGGGGGRGFGGGTRGSSRKIDPDEMAKEQSFWTKYMISIEPVKKAF